MLIGIDFDNTIACYDKVFQEVAKKQKIVDKDWIGKKTDLKKLILKSKKGKELWMKIQGMVYGQYMKNADIMDGFENFLTLSKQLNIDICIISHKTKYGHFDKKKIDLRKEALRWIKKNKILNSNKVYFADTREEKISIINDLKCNIFIDDLIEVLDHDNLNKNTRRIHLSSSNSSKIKNFPNWHDIKKNIFKNDDQFIKKAFELNTGKKISQINVVKGRGNSKIFKIKTKNKNFVLKLYPDKNLDYRKRQEIEFEALNLLEKESFKNIPSTVFKNDELNISAFTWIDGTEPKRLSQYHINQAIKFLKKLKKISLRNSFKNKKASEACLSYIELKRQISHKTVNLLNKNKNEKSLIKFISEKLSPISEEFIQKGKIIWPKESRTLNLKRKKRILSPSDFGFHNSLITKDKKLYFIDFDYFGWDDPVKLVADFYWHPGMNLNSSLKKLWLDKAKKIFKDDDIFFNERLKAALPLYGIRWILIILNIFDDNVASRRLHANKISKTELKEIKKIQLDKADKMLSYILNFNS